MRAATASASDGPRRQAGGRDQRADGGRTRIGVGVGWNQVEYQSLGASFHNRGRRLDELVEVMRKLWCNELVTFESEWHTIVDAGFNPLPIQRPIPIWMGGWSDTMIERIARIGDGWLAYCDLESEGKQLTRKTLRQVCRVRAGPSEIGIAGWIFANRAQPWEGFNQTYPSAHELRHEDEWARDARAWKAAGATHIDLWTMYGKADASRSNTSTLRAGSKR